MNENMIPREWKENFRMSERSFCILCEELGPYIQKQTTRFRKQISIEKQVASTLYCVPEAAARCVLWKKVLLKI